MSTSSPEQRAALLKDVASRKRFYEGQYGPGSEIDLMFRLAAEVEVLERQRGGEGDVASGTLWRAERDRDFAVAEHAVQMTLRRKAIVALVEALDRTAVLESRIAAALDIADGMCSTDRHFGMTIEGRGEVIRAALSGTAVGGETR